MSKKDEGDYPASHYGADDGVGNPNVSMRKALYFNGHGQLIEVNQIDDTFPKRGDKSNVKLRTMTKAAGPRSRRDPRSSAGVVAVSAQALPPVMAFGAAVP